MAASKKEALTFEEITAAADIPGMVEVPIPAWGGVVKIRGLTRGEVMMINQLEDDEADAASIQKALIEPTVTQEQVRQLLNEKGTEPVNTLLNAILEASGIRPGFRPGQAD